MMLSKIKQWQFLPSCLDVSDPVCCAVYSVQELLWWRAWHDRVVSDCCMIYPISIWCSWPLLFSEFFQDEKQARLFDFYIFYKLLRNKCLDFLPKVFSTLVIQRVPNQGVCSSPSDNLRVHKARGCLNSRCLISTGIRISQGKGQHGNHIESLPYLTSLITGHTGENVCLTVTHNGRIMKMLGIL